MHNIAHEREAEENTGERKEESHATKPGQDVRTDVWGMMQKYTHTHTHTQVRVGEEMSLTDVSSLVLM